MWTNYFKLALRNLGKRKGYSLLNILGLSIGITCCLLLFQYVSYEKNYDNFSDEADNIYRVRLDSYQSNKLAWQSATSYPITGPYLKKDYPEVESFCRLHDAEMLLSNDEKQVKFSETKGYHADTSAIGFFGIQLVEGDPQKALEGPDKIILSESMAKKYFGNGPGSYQHVIGKSLIVRNSDYTEQLIVTGVFKDYPAQSHLIINYLVSYATLGKIMKHYGDTSNSTETQWGWYDFYTYLKLKPGTDPKAFEAKMPAFCRRYYPDLEWAKNNKAWDEVHLVPMKEIHLNSNYNQEAEVNGNGRSVGFLFLVAFFIMAIAWINYINLATARSVERAREVGVRKVLGAMRLSLVKQFVIESLILNISSLVLALIATLILAPLFNEFSGHNAIPGFSISIKYWLIFTLVFTLGTLLSSLYPAIVLSGYQPVTVLKGVFKNSAGGLILRKGLIIMQFATSVILIAGTIIVYQQVEYMRKQDLGFNIRQTLVLNGASSLNDSVYQNVFQPFKTEMLQIPAVKSVTASSGVMGKEIYWTNDVKRTATKEGNEKTFTLYHLGIDYDFIPAYEMKLVAGRNYSKDFGTDKKAAIINESACRLLGFESPVSALNQKILDGNKDTLTLIGVAANFHHQGLQKIIDPQLLLLNPNARSNYSLKIASADMPATIASVKRVWDKYFPSDPFNYFFLDEFYDQQYKTSSLFGNVFAVFACIAIVLACFGLLGLSAYNILQRTKEIGIRKVMGANTNQLVMLLSKDFLKLVIVAALIGVPVTWIMMNVWLKDFAYRISISWWVFVVAGIATLFITLATICFHALKAAVANPVKSLRTE